MIKRVFAVILMLMTLTMPLSIAMPVSAEESSDISLYTVYFESVLTVSVTI